MKRRNEPSSLMSEDEEENYFVSLSDLMTGVLFVFVILTTALALHYHLEAGKLAKEKQKTQLARDDADKAKGEATKAHGKARQVQEALDALAKVLREREQLRKVELLRLVDRLGDRKLLVELDVTNGILRLPEELLFESGKADLQSAGKKAVAILSEEIKTISGLDRAIDSKLKWEAVYVEGHTDDKPTSAESKFEDNWELSSARAISTFKAILDAQPDLGTLRNHQDKIVFGISGYGEQRPVADNSTDEGRQKNRRIDIRFVMAYPSQAEIAEMEQKLKQATETMEATKP